MVLIPYGNVGFWSIHDTEEEEDENLDGCSKVLTTLGESCRGEDLSVRFLMCVVFRFGGRAGHNCSKMNLGRRATSEREEEERCGGRRARAAKVLGARFSRVMQLIRRTDEAE